MKKQIFNTSGYEQAIRVILLGVSGDSANILYSKNKVL